MDESFKCALCKYFGNGAIASILKGSVLNKIGKKGLNTLKNTSKEKKDNLHEYLDQLMVKQADIYVHQNCRAKHSLKREASESPNDKSVAEKRMRSFVVEPVEPVEPIDTEFDFSSNCFLCSKSIMSRKDLSRRSSTPDNMKDWSYVNGPSVSDTILSISGDGSDLTSELQNVQNLIRDVDLQLKEAKYHRHCFISFLKRHKSYTSDRSKSNKYSKVDAYMKKIYDYIESDTDCQLTIKQLREIAKTDAEDPVERL